MEKKPLKSRRLRQVLHSLGFSCIGAAIFLQILVFMDILRQGYFMAVERNMIILSIEIVLTFFGLIYFFYIYRWFLRSVK
ncbi:hypothetical protein J7K06_00715 [Candidatus Bathyarchaeota archaeon]|nr:hypothetical protein [Candidatus Bathyarchaeota archaeon]